MSISLITIAGLPLGDSGPVFALVQGQPDSPFGDILGYVIIFFVVIWPIIKGVLSSAGEQRKKHEEKQRQGGGAKEGNPPKRTRLDAFLKELVAGQRPEQDVGDVEARVEAPPAPPVRVERVAPVVPPPVRQRLAPPARTPVRVAPVRAPSPAEVQAQARAQARARAVAGSVGAPVTGLHSDAFDRSMFDGDLVPESALTHAPSENVIESGQPRSAGIERAALSEAQGLTGVTEDTRVSGLVRIHRGRTPWQAAFVLKEALGAPGGLSASDSPYR